MDEFKVGDLVIVYASMFTKVAEVTDVKKHGVQVKFPDGPVSSYSPTQLRLVGLQNAFSNAELRNCIRNLIHHLNVLVGFAKEANRSYQSSEDLINELHRKYPFIRNECKACEGLGFDIATTEVVACPICVSFGSDLDAAQEALAMLKRKSKSDA